jgi:hypothetical protein
VFSIALLNGATALSDQRNLQFDISPGALCFFSLRKSLITQFKTAKGSALAKLHNLPGHERGLWYSK